MVDASLDLIVEEVAAWHCALHGTMTRCPWPYMDCTQPGDPGECKGHLIAERLKSGQTTRDTNTPLETTKPWQK